MSADNWAICPKCKKDKNNKIVSLRKEVEEKYGKLPLDEWESLKIANEKKMELELEYTLREDYQIGVNEEGEFAVDYSASCNVCDFRFFFEHSEEIKNGRNR